jgi:hypothetical protein
MHIVYAGIAAVILCTYGAHILQGFSAMLFFNMDILSDFGFHSVIVFVIRAYGCLLYFEWVDICPASKCYETLGIQQNLCIWTLAAFQDLPNSNTLKHSGFRGLTRMLDPCMQSMSIKGVDLKGKSRQGCIVLFPKENVGITSVITTARRKYIET